MAAIAGFKNSPFDHALDDGVDPVRRLAVLVLAAGAPGDFAAVDELSPIRLQIVINFSFFRIHTLGRLAQLWPRVERIVNSLSKIRNGLGAELACRISVRRALMNTRMNASDQ